MNDNNSEIDIPVESVIPPVESPEDDFGDGDDFGDFGDDDFGDFGGEGDDFGDFGDAPAEDQFADFGNFNDPPSEPLQSDLVPVSMSSIWDEIESSTNSAVTAPEPDPAGLPGGTGWQDEEEIIKRLFDCLNAVSLNLIWKKSNFSHIVEEAKPKLIQMSQEVERERLEKVRVLEEEKRAKKAQAMTPVAKTLLGQLPDLSYINSTLNGSRE